ncbi:MAG: NEW3 domain-containing protein [Gemmatimonadota bacterium]
MRPPPFVLLLLMAAAPVRTAAQQVEARHEVAPGGVATTLVTLTPPPGVSVDSVRYSVDVADGIRLFAPATGTAKVLGDTVRLPLTFGVPATAPAGPLAAGRVTADWGGPRTEQTFSVRVKARYALRFWLGDDVLTAMPGTPATLNYHLDNRGNAVDTVAVDVRAPLDWQGMAVPARVVLAPGDTASGTIQLAVPATAKPGAEHIIAVAASGHAGRDSRPAKLIMVSPQNWFGNLQYVPSSLFIGSSTAGSVGPGVALQATGVVAQDSRLDLEYRYREEPFAPPAFLKQLAGPVLRIGIQRPEWRVHVGDVFSTSDAFTGPALQGRGVEGQWHDSTHSASLSVSQPSTFQLRPQDGHIVRGSAGMKTTIGSFTVEAVDYRRAGDYFEGYGATAGGVRYEYSRGNQRLSVLAGLMGVRSDSSGTATGPALEADYEVLSDRGNLSARIRRVPATVVRTSAYGNEFLLSGNHAVVDPLSALGWVYLSGAKVLGAFGPTRSRGASLGLRYRLGSRGQVQVTGNYRDSERSATEALKVTSLYRTVAAGLHLPLGPLSAQIDGEFGKASNVLTGPSTYRYANAGFQWSHDRQWVWLGTSYQDIGFGRPFLYLSMSGAFDAGPVQVQGGLSGRIDHVALADAIRLWSGTTVSLGSDLDATIGIDYEPTTVADRWRLSLGFVRKFNLPLPIRRPPAVTGTVFEDRNGNRILDADEPRLPGITVRFGPLRTVTDEDGRFRFRDAVEGGRLRIDAADLPLGLRVPADVRLPSAGQVDIPVVRTAALDVALFVDANDNGKRDPDEQPDTSAVVSLVGPDGRARDVAVDATGHANFTGIDPGKYRIVVHPTSPPQGRAAPVSRDVTIESGDTLHEAVALPLQRREIRVRGGGILQPGSGTPEPANDAPPQP